MSQAPAPLADEKLQVTKPVAAATAWSFQRARRSGRPLPRTDPPTLLVLWRQESSCGTQPRQPGARPLSLSLCREL